MNWIKQGVRFVVAGVLVGSVVAGFGLSPAHHAHRGEITIKSLTLSPNAITTGTTSTATVTLSDAAPSGGVVVDLASDKAGVTVPSYVNVPEAKNTATFKISANKDAEPGIVSVSGQAGGETRAASLHLLPYITEARFGSGGVLVGTVHNTFTVTLSAVPKEDVTVKVTSDAAWLVTSETITIPAGNKSYTHSIEAHGLDGDMFVSIHLTIAATTTSYLVRVT